MGFAVYGGLALGAAVSSPLVAVPRVVQVCAWSGYGGLAGLDGGGRGRSWLVTGVFVGATVGDVLSQEAALLSMADGIGRVFLDTQGRSWPNVLLEGDYRPAASGALAVDGGWCLPFMLGLVGLV